MDPNENPENKMSLDVLKIGNYLDIKLIIK